MEECVICCRAGEGSEVYSVLTGQLIKSLGRGQAQAQAGAQSKPSSVTDYSIKTCTLLKPTNGSSSILARISTNPGRAGLTTISLDSTPTEHRFIPPVELSCVSISPGASFIAGGTKDGSILVWELETGTLLSTIDGHYQAITQLEFTNDEAGLIAGSQDGAITVNSISTIAGSSSSSGSVKGYARLSDHTLGITAIAVGLGSFPNVRLLTASKDNTAKLWDLSIPGGVVVSTFAFASPLTHLAWDKLERFFFAVTTKDKTSTLSKVNLYQKRNEIGYELDQVVGGGGRGDVQLATDATEYKLNNEVISAVHLTDDSRMIIIGTEQSAIQILGLPSLLPTRIINPPPTTTHPGPISFIHTLTRSILDKLERPLYSDSGSTKLERALLSGGIGRVIRPIEWAQNGGNGGRKVELNLGSNQDVRQLLDPLSPFLNRAEPTLALRGAARSIGRETELEEELGRVRAQLAKAVGLNEAIWKKVVDGGLKNTV